ncbi:hypothetical protein CFOL_v3_02709 [Cephalotus follicularis]|uniref:Uncharacterized protein n=1 Tax=Cephalotus follicularis TaxID=3775 RepID=A0A1Q3ATX2_CEPFO|nr:hypothetical protein CFOL_v3_02709 [Cephalotus follicularis]
MSVFKFPKGLCDYLTKPIKKFWWGQKVNERKIHWMTWRSMCLKKGEGGLINHLPEDAYVCNPLEDRNWNTGLINGCFDSGTAQTLLWRSLLVSRQEFLGKRSERYLQCKIWLPGGKRS